MKRKITRRSFIRQSSILGSALMMAGAGLTRVLKASPAKLRNTIAVTRGLNYFDNTIKSIDSIGGINNIIKNGDKVSILINAKFDYEGAFVNPLIPLAVIQQCHEAGASSVKILQVVPDDYWERVPESGNFNELTSSLSYVESNDFPSKFNEKDFTKLDDIKGTVALKKAEVVKEIFECDKFINIAIAKHHAGTLYTGLLKNLMGLCTRETNVSFHLGSGKKNDPEYLAQCVADINTIRKPDLCVLDGTSFITTSGPVGPGKIKTLNYVAAGFDAVAMDSLGADWNDYLPEEIWIIQKAYEMGLGEMALDKINVEWINT